MFIEHLLYSRYFIYSISFNPHDSSNSYFYRHFADEETEFREVKEYDNGSTAITWQSCCTAKLTLRKASTSYLLHVTFPAGDLHASCL